LHLAILPVKREMLEAFVNQCVYAAALWSALRVYARKRIFAVPDGRTFKLLIQSTFTSHQPRFHAGLPAATHLGVTCRSFSRCVAAQTPNIEQNMANLSAT
jgi:hypothetical protein